MFADANGVRTAGDTVIVTGFPGATLTGTTVGSSDRFVITAGAGAQTITTGSGNDTISGGAGEGSLGADTITGCARADSIDGRDSADIYIYSTASDSTVKNTETTASRFDIVTVTAGDIFDSGANLDGLAGMLQEAIPGSGLLRSQSG